MRGASLPEAVDRYRVIRRMTTGATTDVLLASSRADGGPDRTVVLKILLDRYAQDEQFAATFVAAAADYARLEHPAIVQLHEVLREPRPVLVLEHVEGLSLPRLRGMLKAVGYDIDDTAALHVAAEIFSALAAAHGARDASGVAAPVVHRYLSPSATIVSWTGDVRVRDFGIPKPLNHERLVVVARGPDGYMAPEQVTGAEVTPAADVYAAALVLWELLTKARAFPRTKRKLAMLRSMAEPRLQSLDVLRPDLDERLREVLGRALAPAVEDRRISASEIAKALRDVVPVARGRERMAALMEMVRHQPSPVVSDAPPPPAMPAREPSLPPEPVTVQVAPRLPPPPAAPRVTSIAGSPRTRPVALPRTSVAGAIALARGEPVARPLSSGTMPAVRRLEETDPEPAPAAPIAAPIEASPVVMIGEPTAPPTEPEAFHVLPKVMVVDVPKHEPPAPAAEPDPIPIPMTPIALLQEESESKPDDDRTDPTMELAWRRRSGFGALTFVTVAGFLLVGWTIGHFIRSATRAAPDAPADVVSTQLAPVASPAPPSPPPVAVTSTRTEPIERAAATATATSTPTSTAENGPEIPSSMGLLHSANLKAGRRIFVDGRTVGETPKSLLVKCGQQTVKIGSAGRKQVIDIPCGEAFTLSEP